MNFNLIFCNKYSVNIKLMVLIISAFKSYPVSVLYSNQLSSIWECLWFYLKYAESWGKKLRNGNSHAGSIWVDAAPHTWGYGMCD